LKTRVVNKSKNYFSESDSGRNAIVVWAALIKAEDLASFRPTKNYCHSGRRDIPFA